MNLRQYIEYRIHELDKQKDLTELNLKGKFSFGIVSNEYAHLPSWDKLVKRKKALTRWIWIDAYFITMMIILFISDFTSKLDDNFWLALLKLTGATLVIGTLIVISHSFSTFIHFRMAEREIRKLIYEDMLERINRDSSDLVEPSSSNN